MAQLSRSRPPITAEGLPRDAGGKLICGADTPEGKRHKTCHRPAGRGTSHPGSGRCAWHYGDSPTGKERAAKEAVVELAQYTGMGTPIHVNPADAILQEVERAAGNVAFYQAIIDSWSYTEGQVASLLVQLNGDMFEKSTILKMYNEERDRLVLYAKTAIAAGIAERVVRMAEQQAMTLNQTIINIIVDLGHQPGDPVVRGVVARRLLEARQPTTIEAQQSAASTG